MIVRVAAACGCCDSPFDRKPRDSWFLRKYIPPHPLDDGFRWWFGVQLLAVVFVVDVVADADELAGVIGAGEEDDGDTENFG